MNLFLPKITRYNFFLISILLFFLIVNRYSYEGLLGEDGVLEITQTILIALSVVLNLKYFKLFLKSIKKFIFNIKILFFIILFYEEISILTTDIFGFLGSFNTQSELNLHNARILTKPLENINLINNDVISFIPLHIIFSGILLIIGFGSYFSIFRSIKFLFLEKKFSIYVLIYPLNLILSYLLRGIFISPNGFLLDQEFVELFIYLILFIDTLEKVKLAKIEFSN